MSQRQAHLKVHPRIDPPLARMCAFRRLVPGWSRRADQRRVRFAQSHCHSPNFRIAGSHDIRALIESQQCGICKNASYTAACDAICHMDISAHAEWASAPDHHLGGKSPPLELALARAARPSGELRALALVQVPVPIVTLGISANRLVVVERVQNLALGAPRRPFLLADRAVNGKNDEYFSQCPLLVEGPRPAFSGDN